MLLITNLRTNANIPWSVAVMGILLWVLWQYLDGRGPLRSTAETRHRLLRAARVSRPRFTWAIFGGLLGITALAGLWIVLLQLVGLPARVLPDLSRYPPFTVATVIVMACLVSSVPEEAAIRGYFQSLLEQKVSGPLAIGIAAVVMAPAHCLTQGFLWPVVLFYFLVDLMLGTIAYLTKSILPGIAVHFIGLLVFFTLIWPYDTTRVFTSDGVAKRWLWIHVAQIVICGVFGLLAFWRLKLQREPKRPNQAMERTAGRSDV